MHRGDCNCHDCEAGRRMIAAINHLAHKVEKLTEAIEKGIPGSADAVTLGAVLGNPQEKP